MGMLPYAFAVVCFYLLGTVSKSSLRLPPTVLRFGVKVAVVRYLNFSKNAKNCFNMQFEFILNVFCQEIDSYYIQVSNFILKP